MITADTFMAAAVLVLEAGSVMLIAARLTSWWCHDQHCADDSLLRCLVGVVIAVATVLGILQVCGTLDALSRGPVLAAHLALAAAVLTKVPRGRRPARAWWWRVRPSVPLAVGVFFGVLSLKLGLSGGPSTEAETVRYHAADAGFWLQSHNLWHLFTTSSPGNGELAALWLMMPSHTDQLAYAVNVVFGVLAVLAAAVAARELGGPPWAGALGGLAVVLVPLSFQTQTHSLRTDLAGASGILAGVALALVAVRSPGRARWAVLAGLALGVGVGSKVTAVLPAAGVLVLVVWLMRSDLRVRRAGAAMAGMVALAGLWWVRWVVVGGPSWPAGLSGHDRSLLGPALLLAAIGAVAPTVIGVWNRWPAGVLLGALTAVCLLADPLIADPLVALLIAAVAAVAAMPRTTAGVAAAVLVWDAVHDLRSPAFRTDIHPAVADLGLAAVVTALVILATSIRIPTRLPRGLAFGVAAAVMTGLAPAYAQLGAPASPLDRVLAGGGHVHGQVMVVGQTDLRPLMGATFSNQVVSASPSPHPDAATLQAAVDRLHPAAVVVPAQGGPGIGSGWAPLGYTQVGTVGGNPVYAPTLTPSPPTPAPPPPTSPPPTSPPPTSPPPTSPPPTSPTTSPPTTLLRSGR